MQLGFRATQRNDWTILHVAGEIDMATAPEVRQHAVRLIADGRSHLVLSFLDVSFCDSTGLGVLVAIVKRARTIGGDIRLVTMDDRLMSLLELTRLDQVVDVYDSITVATDQSPTEEAANG